MFQPLLKGSYGIGPNSIPSITDTIGYLTWGLPKDVAECAAPWPEDVISSTDGWYYVGRAASINSQVRATIYDLGTRAIRLEIEDYTINLQVGLIPTLGGHFSVDVDGENWKHTSPDLNSRFSYEPPTQFRAAMYGSQTFSDVKVTWSPAMVDGSFDHPNRGMFNVLFYVSARTTTYSYGDSCGHAIGSPYGTDFDRPTATLRRWP